MAKTTKVNLAKLFGSVASELAKNQSTLNQADKQNKDHGTNMVNVFNTITSALEDKPKAAPSDQLEYAAEQVRQNCQTGSGTVYADGLARAADTLQGQNITSENAMQLITALLGSSTGGQTSSPAASGDPMASLLGSLMGGTEGQPSSGNTSADALSSLLGGLMGGETPAQPAQSAGSGSTGGIGLENILAAGLEFVQSQKQGQDTMSSLLDAVVAGSQAGSGYREQSGKLVAGTLLQGLSSLLTQSK
jgi:hypothetical protein